MYDTGVVIEMPFPDLLELCQKYSVKADLQKTYNPQHWQEKRFGIVGQADFTSGYGNTMYNLLKYSQQAGYDIRWTGKLIGEPDKVIRNAKREIPPDMAMVWHEQPKEHWRSSPFAKNIALTMFETTRVPESWVPRLNSLDAVCVPCKQNIGMMANSGVKIPVELTQLGIDETKFYPLERNNEVFTFGHLGALTVRKGTDLLVEAFRRAFSSKQKVKLINKTSLPYYPFMVKDKRVEVQQAFNGIPHSELIETFFKKINCFVYPSRGEGFGLPPLEAMATGVPAITTNWSGMAEYNNEEVGWMLNDFKMVPADNFTKKVYKEDCGEWAEPNLDELIFRLRYAYEHQDEVKEKGRKAAEYVKANWLWRDKIKMFHEALAKHL